MPTALIPITELLDTLWQARLLCWRCEERPWTQVGRWHRTLLCDECAALEPNPHEEDGDMLGTVV